MPPVKQSEAPRASMGEGRLRYLAHTDNLMMVVIDFTDGPSEQPDPPHQHPHEQITYVVEGEVNFFLDGVSHKLSPGDMMTVPPNVPHCIQLLSSKVRLVDSFNPLREDFLK